MSSNEVNDGSEVLHEILDMLETNFSLLAFDTRLGSRSVDDYMRAYYGKTKTFYLRLNRLGRRDLKEKSSTGEGREFALDALVKCSNDLDCIFEIIRLGAPGLFPGGIWRN